MWKYIEWRSVSLARITTIVWSYFLWKQKWFIKGIRWFYLRYFTASFSAHSHPHCDLSITKIYKSSVSRLVEDSSFIDTKLLITYVNNSEISFKFMCMKNVYTKLVFVDLSHSHKIVNIYKKKRKEANSNNYDLKLCLISVHSTAKKQPLKTINDVKQLIQQGKKREVKLIIRENAWPVNATIRSQLWPELCAQHQTNKDPLSLTYWESVNTVSCPDVTANKMSLS